MDSLDFIDNSIVEICTRCRLACGLEAEALGLPTELGYFLHDYGVQIQMNNDDVGPLKKNIDVNVVYTLLVYFGLYEKNKYEVYELYGKCFDNMEMYGQLINQVA